MSELYEQDPLMIQESLEDWVMTKCEDWRDHYESNYEAKFCFVCLFIKKRANIVYIKFRSAFL